jgi:hypothetical protein
MPRRGKAAPALSEKPVQCIPELIAFDDHSTPGIASFHGFFATGRLPARVSSRQENAIRLQSPRVERRPVEPQVITVRCIH